MRELANPSLQDIKGIGPKMLEQFLELRISSIEDLFYYFPNRYDHYEMKPLHELQHEEKVTIVGQVILEPVLQFYQKKKIKACSIDKSRWCSCQRCFV